jgi:FkbM family methyltransferase
MEYRTVSPETAVGYMGPHINALKEAGIDIKSILDIGAAHGHFSRFMKHYYPDASVTAIECNPEDKHFLDSTNWNVIYTCLGDKKCTKTFYTNPNEPVGGGSSFYLENTEYFNKPTETQMQIQTLDSLNLGGFDLIKIDTQGSEHDIIAGGTETIQKTRFLLLELSFLEYNKGGALIDDVLAQTRSLGFRMLDTFGPEYGGHWWKGRKIQADVLLAREGDNIFNFGVV